MLKYNLMIGIVNRFVKKRMVKPNKANLPSLPAPPLSTMHNKTNTLNNPSFLNIKALTSQSCMEPLSPIRNQTYIKPSTSRNHKLNVSELLFDNKKRKKNCFYIIAN